MSKIAAILVVWILLSGCENFKGFDILTRATKKNITQPPKQKKIPDRTLEMLLKHQQEIITVLTGEKKIYNEIFIKSRWSAEEKIHVRKYLSRKLSEIGLDAQEMPYEVSMPEYRNKSKIHTYIGNNLYAYIPATNLSEEYIIIGAHYDTVKETPGASDNATGCAAILGIAKLLMQLNKRTKNVFIVFFDQEEVSHAGAFVFANFLKDKGYDVNSVHTIDQVGWDKDGDRNIELELPTKTLKMLYKKQASSFGITTYRTDVTGSDHREFRDAGFPAVGITEELKHGDTSPHHHEHTDTLETVDFEFLAFVTYFVLTTVQELVTS